jgi:hypothetical protein
LTYIVLKSALYLVVEEAFLPQILANEIDSSRFLVFCTQVTVHHAGSHRGCAQNRGKNQKLWKAGFVVKGIPFGSFWKM